MDFDHFTVDSREVTVKNMFFLVLHFTFNLRSGVILFYFILFYVLLWLEREKKHPLPV